jgi:hypothetical protein
MPHAYWDLLDKTIPFELFLDSVRKWYAGMPYDVTDRNQNGRSSESHQACLNGRVATDEDEVNEQFYQALFYALPIGLGADVHAERLRVGELCSGMDRTSDDRRTIDSYDIVQVVK